MGSNDDYVTDCSVNSMRRTVSDLWKLREDPTSLLRDSVHDLIFVDV